MDLRFRPDLKPGNKRFLLGALKNQAKSIRWYKFDISVRWGDESKQKTVAANFDRGDEPPMQTPTTVALRGKNLHRDICVPYI